VMGTTQVLVYLPFLTIAGCITGLFTGFVAMEVVKHWPTAVAFSLDSKKESHTIEKK